MKRTRKSRFSKGQQVILKRNYKGHMKGEAFTVVDACKRGKDKIGVVSSKNQMERIPTKFF